MSKPSRREVLSVLAGSPLLAALPGLAIADKPGNEANLKEAIRTFFEGWRSGVWTGFLSRCAASMVFQFPVGPFRGRWTGKQGKETLEKWCMDHVRAGDRITSSEVSLELFAGDWAVICDRGSGRIGGQPYSGLHAIFMRVDGGGQIVEFREYFGEV